jgi:hypothetical protein
LKRIVAILLSIICVICLASCAPVSDVDGLSVTVPTEGDSVATLPPPGKEVSSTELRVAIRRETNMNPLYPKHYATRSLLALAYESLFKVDHEGKIVPGLAESIAYDVETMTYRIQIDNQKTFHNGKKLTSQDVQASLLKTISLSTAGFEYEEGTTDNTETGEEDPSSKSDTDDLSASFEDGAHFQASPFSAMVAAKNKRYLNIRQVLTEGANIILLELQKPDPRIAELLTFAIVPESDVDQRSMNPIPGSGDWRVVSAGGGRLVTLERVTSGSGIRQITATVYEDAAFAMNAFDEGDLDVLVLDASETSIYADRTRIRKQRIDYPGYISLYFRETDRASALLSRNYMVREIRSDSKGEYFAAPFDRAYYPLLSGDFRQQNASIPEYQIPDLPALERPNNQAELQDSAVDSDVPANMVPDTRDPFVLLIPEGFTPYRLVDNIGACVARLGRKFSPVTVSKSEWASKLRRDSYDAALLIDETHLFLDPVGYLEGLNDAGLFDWTQYVDADDVVTLLEAQHLVSSPEGENREVFSESAYAQTVSRVFSVLPVIGISIPETMVLYGSNVEGTLAGIWRSPYENVEDLIVWRP